MNAQDIIDEIRELGKVAPHYVMIHTVNKDSLYNQMENFIGNIMTAENGRITKIINTKVIWTDDIEEDKLIFANRI